MSDEEDPFAAMAAMLDGGAPEEDEAEAEAEAEQEVEQEQAVDAAATPESAPCLETGTIENRQTASTVEWRVFTVPSGELAKTAS